MPECHPLPQQIRNHFLLAAGDTQSTHVHRGSWLVPLSLYPSASVLFHLRSVSSHSFEVAVRGFPKEKQLLLVNCILGIVNQSEQSRQRGLQAGNTSSFLYTRPFGIWSPPSYLFFQFQQAVLCVCRLSSAFHSHNPALLPPGPATSEGITIS